MISKSNATWIIVIIAIAAGIYFTYTNKKDTQIRLKAERLQGQSLLKERYKKGAYIDNESKLSDYETTKTIIYPGKSQFGNDYDEMYDTTCLVYTNTQLKQSKVKCSGLLFDTDDETNGEMRDVENETRYGRYE